MKLMHRIFIIISSFAMAVLSCQSDAEPAPYDSSSSLLMNRNPSDPYRFLALGDSYTIGEAVEESARWPVQLVEKLRSDEIPMVDPVILAQTGWTTDELLMAIENSEVDSIHYDLVSLLVGVNNQYRSYPIDQYREEFELLLKTAISLADQRNANVWVFSIPDYGVTPFAAEKNLDPDVIATELDAYNDMARSICDQYEVQFFDITTYSRQAAEKENLIASDGLHPSGIMYQNWVETCYAWVYQNLSAR
jgi:lysophospholipase L1-like esterase